MVNALDAAVGRGVAFADVDLVDAKADIDGRELGEKLLAVVGDKRHRAPPEGTVLVDEDVRGAGGCELRCRDGGHVGAADKAVGEDEEAEVAARGERQWADVAYTDGDPGAVGQGQGRPADRSA